MKIISKALLATCFIAFTSAASQLEEPQTAVLNYGQTSVSAPIQVDRGFDAVEDNDEEIIELSGSVIKEYSDYVVDVLVVRKSKSRHSSRELKTTLFVQQDQLGKPMMIGGVNNEVFTLTLK
ncbi:hypothetical protein KS872_003799 [Vibrio parahaemolyticus]|uniref:hypothetical protein n=1 Tax=Vibrio parahaemolyticus TaxID=670 RepID=UPI0004230F78|nr:hypothetical protein [Vibrio parahaemolyticus]EHR0574028.1 hypothetical protein [Vibrio parahaemolyticus]EME0113684.1 hypothetical protein [Vibrio parahaemolyticus]MCR9654887.1 hypothetical protein [Vibrio parahaemolyticus]